MSFPCPKCHDRNTRSLEMVYAHGIGYTRLNGMSIMYAPPEKRQTGWLILLMIPLLALPCLLLSIGLFGVTSAGPSTASSPSQISAPVSLPQPKDKIKTSKNRVPPAAPTTIASIPQPGKRDDLQKPVSPTVLLIPLLFLLAPLSLVIFGLVRVSRYNRNVWPILMQNWRDSFLCRGCGYVFMHAQAASISAQLSTEGS